MTGPDSPNNTIQRFAITGTDLGIMWDNGDPANKQVLMAFGDTNGYCSVPGKQWRYNVLFRTADRALTKTINIPNGAVRNKYSGSPVWAPGLSKQIINSIKFSPTETGIIPTAGISVGRNQYVSFMSIRNWDSPGSVDDELLGDRGVARQRRELGCLPAVHPPGRAGQRPASPVCGGE